MKFGWGGVIPDPIGFQLKLKFDEVEDTSTPSNFNFK